MFVRPEILTSDPNTARETLQAALREYKRFLAYDRDGDTLAALIAVLEAADTALVQLGGESPWPEDHQRERVEET